MNPMASLDTPEVSGDVVLLIAVIGVAAIILMAAFLTFLYYRDRAEDQRSSQEPMRHRSFGGSHRRL
jgi:hypothetical protein